MALPWVRMDTQWPNNPKFLQLVEDKRWRAVAVYWAGLAWSGSQGQAGFLPAYALPMIHASKKEASDLTDVALWVPAPGGWNINDWAEYQPTTEEQEERSRKARSAAQARWAKRNGNGSHDEMLA
jgi:hypothetical protein